jgi:predicted exporter/SAM-dependent methyltransferase
VEGRLVSADGRHLLIPASPAASGTDTTFARRLTKLIQDLQNDLNADDAARPPVVLTAVGAFRAALDNETIIRRDVNNAIAWSTAGIAVLLVLTLSRPLIGLLALVPALAGTAAALLVYTLLEGRISVLALGFGGAVISISVDHGITYLLFLDRPEARDSLDAGRETRAVGLVAVLTTVGAFGILGFGAFPVFAQIGRFTALGVGFAFIFVHTIFARIFVRQPPAATLSFSLPPGRRRLARLLDRLLAVGPWSAAAAAAAMIVLAGFVPTAFDTDLARMNSVGEATRQADALMTRVWGNLFDRVYLMIEADDPAALARQGDRLLESLDAEAAAGRVAAVVTAATFFPGPDRQRANHQAWRAFWSPERLAALRRDLSAEAEIHGFVPEAFSPFLESLTAPPAAGSVIPEALGAVLGRSPEPAGGRWRQIVRVVPGPRYDPAGLFERLGDQAKIFDPPFFSRHLGQVLTATFQRILAVIGVSIGMLLVVFFADLELAGIAALPMIFGTVCTLGTLGLIGRPLDIATLMLGVVVVGLGVDYALLMVSAFQRYRRIDHPFFVQVRSAIFMGAASALIGFTVLVGADHTVLQSAGITSSLGIGYCLAGTFLIVPPLLRRRFSAPEPATPTARQRYRNLEAYPRIIAHLRLRLDTMFDELGRLLPAGERLHTVIDLGCGHGVTAAWILERHPEAIVYGIEPDAERSLAARLALGKNGVIVEGAAPQVPEPPRPAQLALMIDVIHFLDDKALRQTLRRLRWRLAADGRLVMRSAVAPAPWWMSRLLAVSRLVRAGRLAGRRTVEELGWMLRESGFSVEKSEFSGRRRTRIWTVARPDQAAEEVLRQQSGSEAR